MEDSIGSVGLLKVGGALRRTNFYIRREEDERLLALLRRGEFCHLLASSQTGKTSLAVRIKEQLSAEDHCTAWVDLNRRFNPQGTVDQFCFDVTRDIASAIGLQDQFMPWANEAPDLGLHTFFVDFLLPRFRQRLIVFVDEFDDLMGATFREDFLLQLRALLNARSVEPELDRICFCLIGTFPAGWFSLDPHRSAFNIAHQVLLPDFSREQADQFTVLLRPITSQPEKLMGEVYEKVGGHPYMIQKLISALIRGESLPVPRMRGVVEALARREFSSADDALMKIGQRISRDIARVRGEDKLRLYQALWETGELDYRPQDETQLALRLAGAAVVHARADGTFLSIRNSVVADTFDDEWTAERLRVLYSTESAGGVSQEASVGESPALRHLTKRVDELFCTEDGNSPSPYRRLGPGRELLRSTLYLFPLEDAATTERVCLQVFSGIEGLGGQLWEQEVRALLRLNSRRHDTLPAIRDGGYYRVDGSRGVEGNEDIDLAYIVTDAGRSTLADPSAMEHFRASKLEALRQLNLLAEGLAILHGSGLMHRNLHPGTIQVSARDIEGKDVFLRIERFEMAPLIANLLRRLDPAYSPDGEVPGGRREMDEAVRAYYLDAGIEALVCVAPERLGTIYAMPNGSAIEGANSDVYSLGVIAYQWFVGQLPADQLQSAFGSRTFAHERWEALATEMNRLIGRAPLHARLRELLRAMLDPNPRTRWQSAEVVDYLVRHFDTIAQSLQESTDVKRRPYLIAYLANEIGEFLRRTGLLSGDPASPQGRAELQRFLIQDLGSPILSFAPSGCAQLVANPDERHRKSRFVLQGTRLAYFAHLYEDRQLPHSAPQEVPQALVIRYSVEQAKVRNVNMSGAQRTLHAIEVVSRDSAAMEPAHRTGRPTWKPILESIERSSSGSPAEASFLRALDWLLELQGIQLDARTYPVKIDPADPNCIVYDPERDRVWLSKTDLGSLFYGDRKLRPELADFFEQEADKKGIDQLSLRRDSRGAPDYGGGRAAQLVFDGRKGKDALRVKPHPPLDFTIGWLQVSDDEGTRYQIDQQRRAYFHLTRMPELIRQLQHPSTPARIRQRWLHAGRGLQGRAPEVVRRLLDSWPLFALQGPPGTGKSTVISDAVQQTLDRDRNIRILIAAQSHYALDNLLEKINQKFFESGMTQLDAVRVVSPKSMDRPSFSNVVRRYFIKEVVQARKRSILKHCDEYLEDSNEEPAPGRGMSRRELIGRWRKAIEVADAELHDRLQRGANLVFSTTGTSTDSYLGSSQEEGFDWVIVDESAKAWPTELIMPLVHGQRWALVGDHKQLGAFDKDWVASILDKCRSSPLEELRQVGEQADEFMKIYEVFKGLVEGAKTSPEHRKGYLARPVEVLNEQFRMHPAIAGVISRRFYDNGLFSARITNDRRHNINGLDWLGDKSLVWIDTNGVAQAQESADPKWNNPKEVQAVQAVLNQFGKAAERAVVLSPYGAQVKSLAAQLKFPDNRKQDERVFTVDAFQGREADIVIVSMVRCNDAHPTEHLKRLGFMVEPERVNVLFSRGRELLVVVGSFDQFYKSESPYWPRLCDQIMAGPGTGRVSLSEVLGRGGTRGGGR